MEGSGFLSAAYSPFDGVVGLEILDCTDELVRGRVPVEPHLKQVTGVIHGGVYAAVAETLASIGTNYGVAGDGSIGLGQSNNTSFVRPLSDGELHAIARPRHREADTWVWDVELADGGGRLCALSTVTIAVRPMT